MNEKNTENFLDDEEELLELIPGKTQIGTLRGNWNGTHRTMSIMYGNVASPVIDGQVLRLPEDKYMEMLESFLESEEGLKYRVPTRAESSKAIDDMLTLQEEVDRKRAEKEEAERRRKQQEEQERQRRAEEQKRLEAQREEELRLAQEKQQKEEEERRAKEEQERIDAENRERMNQERLALEKREQRIKKTAAKAKKRKTALIIVTILLLLSLAANGFLLMTGSPFGSSGAPGIGQLDVNGSTYEVKLSPITVNEGETKIVLYGISSTNKDGTVTNRVIEFGEINADGNVSLR
ncbi:MAG: hypothetical protein IKF80_10420 [Erysipelotrichaceae bacterium]|nr:hypothetical protein [Erysipelotrichaceae bacterium]